MAPTGRRRPARCLLALAFLLPQRGAGAAAVAVAAADPPPPLRSRIRFRSQAQAQAEASPSVFIPPAPAPAPASASAAAVPPASRGLQAEEYGRQAEDFVHDLEGTPMSDWSLGQWAGFAFLVSVLWSLTCCVCSMCVSPLLCCLVPSRRRGGLGYGGTRMGRGGGGGGGGGGCCCCDDLYWCCLYELCFAGLVGSLLGSIEAREGYQKQKVWWTCYVPTVFR